MLTYLTNHMRIEECVYAQALHEHSNKTISHKITILSTQNFMHVDMPDVVLRLI